MIINVLLGFFLVLVLMAGNAPSVSAILAAIMAYRVLPNPYGEMAAGLIVVFAGGMARRSIARKDLR